MRVFPNPIAFLRDEGNSSKNLVKHNVTVQEAEEIFTNEPITIADDTIHSTSGEHRLYILGITKTGRKLFAAFTIRARKIRIISVRDMSKKERIEYEELEKNS